MTREELIRELNNQEYVNFLDSQDAKWVADFILRRERLLLEKIGKHLRLAHEFGTRFDDSLCLAEIDAALAIIEKESLTDKKRTP